MYLDPTLAEDEQALRLFPFDKDQIARRIGFSVGDPGNLSQFVIAQAGKQFAGA
jgi:hypothetical protein